MKKSKENNMLYKVAGALLVAIVALYFLLSGGTSSTLALVSGTEFTSTYTNTRGAVLLDVRTKEEYTEGHLEGAINIDFHDPAFSSHLQQLDKTVPYFVYCRSGNRSGQTVSLMKKSGFTSIYELKGGLVGNTQLPLVTGAPTDEYVIDASDFLKVNEVLSAPKTSSLTEKEKQGLILMREEEKLAHDVYTTLGALYGARIFSNIAQSEQTHMDAVGGLISRYELVDPISGKGVGEFSSKELQGLYTKLVDQGKKSLVDALIVGATIEDLDIADLDRLMKETKSQDILTVYSNLEKGSRNHLRAFVKNITNNGGVYNPSYISREMYNTIIASPQERGRI